MTIFVPFSGERSSVKLFQRHQLLYFCNNPLADVYRDTGKRIDHNGLDERMGLSQCDKPSDRPAQSEIHKQQMEHIHAQRDAGYFTDHELHLVGTALEKRLQRFAKHK